MTAQRPRLLINYATPDLHDFERVAETAAAQLSASWAVRMVVSHLAAKDTRQRTDAGDPYLEYSANFPDIFHFVVPDAVRPEIDPVIVEPHLRLADRKLAIVRKLGIGGAFLGREPAYLPESLLARLPHWRGPRVDHPRRSRNPVFAPCFHQPEVGALYRGAVESLVERLPGVDTFYWWTNDSGSGFCWYPYAYPGPNGPTACRELGPIPAMAAFHAAVLDGARAAGAAEPISIMTQSKIWDAARLPNGAYRYPPPDDGPGAASIGADVSLTYPVRYLWDPLRRLEQVRAIEENAPAAAIWWLSDVYHRASIDASSAVRQVRLWAGAAHEPARTDHVSGRLGLLRDFAEGDFGRAAADDVVDAWDQLRTAFTLQTHSPFQRPLVAFLPMYGGVTHRWLSRPLVAFPDELTAAEEAQFLPHVFAVGDDARRNNLLDVHGYPAAARDEAYDLRSPSFRQIETAFLAAAGAFDRAADAADTSAGELRLSARAARLMASVWATSRNWIEFASSRAEGVEAAPTLGSDDELARAEAYRRRLFAILRAELDNTLLFQEVLGEDPEGVVARAARPEDEDTFTLSPDLQSQLTRKRQIMLAHWQDVARLVPRPPGAS